MISQEPRGREMLYRSRSSSPYDVGMKVFGQFRRYDMALLSSTEHRPATDGRKERIIWIVQLSRLLNTQLTTWNPTNLYPARLLRTNLPLPVETSLGIPDPGFLLVHTVVYGILNVSNTGSDTAARR